MLEGRDATLFGRIAVSLTKPSASISLYRDQDVLPKRVRHRKHTARKYGALCVWNR